MIGIMVSTVAPYVKVAAFLILTLFIWALKSSWSEKDKCIQCDRCTEPVLVRMWKAPLLGPVNALGRLWTRSCPQCRHLMPDHEHNYG